MGCHRRTSHVHQRGLRRTRRGRARAGRERGEGRGCSADRSNDDRAVDAQGEARAAGSCDVLGKRACASASDRGAHACVTFSVFRRLRSARVQCAIGCGACRHALPLVCVGCAGAVVAPLTAAVRRLWRKRVQFCPPIPSPKVPRSPQQKTGVKFPCGAAAFLLFRWPPPRNLRDFRPCWCWQRCFVSCSCRARVCVWPADDMYLLALAAHG